MAIIPPKILRQMGRQNQSSPGSITGNPQPIPAPAAPITSPANVPAPAIPVSQPISITPAKSIGAMGSAIFPVPTDSNQITSTTETVIPNSLDTITLIVAPGAPIVIPFEGTSFYVVDTTGTLAIRADGRQSFADYPKRCGRKYNRGYFKFLEVQNNSVANITFTLAIGHDSFIDNRGGT